MADIDDEATMREFRQLTGMLPPGRDEASAAIGQHNYDRGEVRWLMWEVYCKLERQLAAKDVEIKRLADLLGDALAHTHRSYREPILAVLRERAGRPKAAEAAKETP